jgi:hypothetical protein
MSRFWFKPKTYGYGATPATWEGWALVLGHAALVVGCVLLIAFGDMSISRIAEGVIAILLATAGLVWLTVMKTEGQWNWRWGIDNKDRKA